MWTMTGFADEIDPDPEAQVRLLGELGLRHLELRSAWGIKVLDLSGEQLHTVKATLDAAGVTPSCIGSDLGKIPITAPFAPHLERARHAVEVARFFGTSRIRVFSFFIPDGAPAVRFRDEVLARTRAMVDVAAEAGMTLLHENEKDIYGDVPARVSDLLSTIGSPHYRGVFDPANYVQCNVRPMDEAWPLVHEYTDYIHCKDARFPVDADDLGEVVPCGRGDGQWPELLAALKASGYSGFFSLEPHLGDLTAFGAVSGRENWSRAYRALEALMAEVGVEPS
ncbi:sugar phosphate isomerase/epimerase [Actinomyces sp.]|uniref:sugar phosphate isomerase/epimerase family protein n=1 Tax=Actinomyces sp. TaxID=29317 RepID=UPI0026DD3B92|nr:sugar phosphate isomerase/epimerase [Actinomyces sp.]MDO4900784.1 sugar phosphate isomerase/epimerase [Actinomyces sp.]